MPPILMTALFSLILQVVAPHSTIALPRASAVVEPVGIEQAVGSVDDGAEETRLKRPKWW